jgi:predicted ATPase/DNA-binding SARP family transcriptional activator
VVTSSAALEFRVLGPIEAVRDELAVRLGGRRQRALLALLLLEPGRPVSPDRLIDGLWRDTPPPDAERALRVYVSRLRAALGEGAVRTHASGYALQAESERIDSKQFERLLRDGREALRRGSAGLAAERLGAALALWRGDAMSDVADDGPLALEARRLDELRLVCKEELFEAELALGRHAGLVAELERLVADHPLRERLWRQLVVALYQSGRQADALAAYQRARTLFADELGLEPSEELRAVERAVLRHEVRQVPPEQERHNLPAPVTSFVGRERELDDLARLLRQVRLVTLTGMGGAGKTRLAIEAASSQVGVWSGGVWLVDLLPLTEAELVPAAIARTLGIADRPDASGLDGLVDHLRQSEALLVLDNCEHLAAACASVAEKIQRTCAGVGIVATSRTPLGVAGEVDFAVEPLPVPAEDFPAEEIERLASVRLFLDRARAARRDLLADPQALGTVARICREVDGLPLAIELAAARSKLLSLADIAARLDDRLRFLRSWGRMADPRHRTLQATIDWSYELLSDDERALLRRLCVFAGGFSVDAVAAVCLAGDTEAVLERLGRLVDASLVTAEVRGAESRFHLLVTIRAYAAERLGPDSEAAEELRRAHCAYFLELAQQVRIDPAAGPEKHAALAQLDQERDNLHAAVQWALAAESEMAPALCAALWRYWLIRGYRRQGLEWLERALVLAPHAPPHVRGLLLAAAALLARLLGRFERAGELAEVGVALTRGVGPPIARAISLNVLVTLAGLRGDFEAATRLSEESIRNAREAKNEAMEAIALFVLAEAALHSGRYSDAGAAGTRAVELARAREDSEILALALARLGMAAAAERRLPEARAQLGEALEHAATLGFDETAAWCCEGLAVVAADSADTRRAARLLGAAETLRLTGGGIVQPAEAAARTAALAGIGESLPGAQVEVELERGRRMSLHEAAHEALALAL